MKWLTQWLLCAGALLLVAQMYSGVQLQNFSAALIAAAVLGLFNTLLRPVLIVLTLPITVVTLGLFLFVVHAVTFWAASGVLDGFAVDGFEAALVGSVLYSLLCVVIDSALKQLFPPQ
ncbi:MAG: phage holin family protein [Rhodoferax sp.]